MKKIVLLATILLTGCGAEVNDVAYWEKNIPELSAKLDECSNDPAKATSDGNCINARQAKTNLSTEQIRTGVPSPLSVYNNSKKK